MRCLVSWRKRAGKTQKDVAEALGVSQSAVSQWESGEVQIPLSRLSELARWLQVSPEELGQELLRAGLLPGQETPAPAGQEPAPAGQERDLLSGTSQLLTRLEQDQAAGLPLSPEGLRELSERLLQLGGYRG
jgi:transcriptional regulator with XRE-family HTH domain